MKLSELNNNEIAALTVSQKTRLIYATGIMEEQVCEAAIVLGADPAGAQVRAAAAAELYEKGKISIIIPSGGVKHMHNNVMISECDYMASVLKEHNVPDCAVVRENRARNTIENMLCSVSELSLFNDRMMQTKSIAIITHPYHLRRGLKLAKAFLPRHFCVHGYASGYSQERSEWHKDDKTIQYVNNEIMYLKQLISYGIIEDISINDTG